MDRKPLLSFLILVLIGPLFIVTGIELLDVSNADSTTDRWLNIWVPLALVGSGLVMLAAAWRILRFATLGSLMIMGGMSFMWFAPSLQPVIGAILGGGIRFLWDWLSGEPWQVAGGRYLEQITVVFSGSTFFPRELLYQDLIFIVGGLCLTGIGAWFVKQRADPSIRVEFESEDELGKRRVVYEGPPDSLPTKIVERFLR